VLLKIPAASRRCAVRSVAAARANVLAVDDRHGSDGVLGAQDISMLGEMSSSRDDLPRWSESGPGACLWTADGAYPLDHLAAEIIRAAYCKVAVPDAPGNEESRYRVRQDDCGDPTR